jgi:hypothetical protein
MAWFLLLLLGVSLADEVVQPVSPCWMVPCRSGFMIVYTHKKMLKELAGD